MSIQENPANTPGISAFEDSPFGITSFIIAVLNLLYVVLVIFAGRYMEETSLLYKLLDLSSDPSFWAAWYFVAFLGITFCMAGVKKDQRKIFSFLGLLLGAPLFSLLTLFWLFELHSFLLSILFPKG
jgi:hypothetical protein